MKLTDALIHYRLAKFCGYPHDLLRRHHPYELRRFYAREFTRARLFPPRK